MNNISKRLLSTVVATLLAAGPITLVSAASAQGGPQRGQPQQQQPQPQQQPPRDYDRDRDHDGDRNCRDNGGQRNSTDGRCAYGATHHDDRKPWRDTRNNARWDGDQYNGYYSGNDWHYGPPSPDAYNNRNFAFGYHPWASGDRLGYYSQRYVEVDYRSQRLNKPKRGEHWVRDERGIFLLVSIRSGLIRRVINRNSH